MKFTLITVFLATLLTSTNAMAIPKPSMDAFLANIFTTDGGIARREAETADQITARLVEGRDNDCGSGPFQNPDCSAGTNLKIEKGAVILGALVVGVIGGLL